MICWIKCLRKYALTIEQDAGQTEKGGEQEMKKTIAVIVALILMLTLAGCSKNETAPAESETGTVETNETDSDETELTDVSESSEESSEDDTGVLSPEFKRTMDDYEAWFDHYCEVMKKYEENPSDLELLMEMSDLLSEESAMLEQMENMDESDMNAAELAYYIEVTARIEKKLLEASSY